MLPTWQRDVADFAVNNLFEFILRHGERLLVGNQSGRDCHNETPPPILDAWGSSRHLPELPSSSCPARRLLPGAISFEGACREWASAISWNVRRRKWAS